MKTLLITTAIVLTAFITNAQIGKSKENSPKVNHYYSYIFSDSSVTVKLLSDSTIKTYLDKKHLVIQGDSSKAVLLLIKHFIMINNKQGSTLKGKPN